MRLRLLADDLTGALDSAAAFAGEVPVYLDAPPPGAGGDDGVTAVATATRDVPSKNLPALLAPSLHWLRGADLAFKKVDSLLRGNTFAECAQVARSGFTRVVFAPALPHQGRTTSGGRAWLVQPGSSVPQPIGERAIVEAFTALDVPGPLPDLWAPDVRSDDDLHRIAALSQDASSRGWLWCGSAGLAHAIARVHGLAAARAEPIVPSLPPLMLVSASHHPVVRRQWTRLRAAWPASPLWFDLSPAERLTPEAAAALLARQVQSIAERRPRPATLVVVGGDTLRALCRATGATALRARASPRAGWGRALLQGGRWDGVPVHSRSGAFGSDDDLLEIVDALT
jgi:uncharacterized protein YgbK (DUF1537 family)